MEPRPEQPSQDGISLFSPTDEFPFLTDTFFEGKELAVPGIGTVHMEGERGFTYDERDIGITLQGRNFLIESAAKLRDSGLFELKIGMSIPVPKLYVCKMVLSEGSNFGSHMFITPDDPRNPQNAYASHTQSWQRQGNTARFLFFVPADPIFLSSPRFSFRQITDER